MGAFIARQPNGLLCRFSSVVDCITDYNMTEEEYIEMCAQKAMEEAKYVLSDCVQPFNLVKEMFAPRNMTIDDFKVVLNEMENPAENGAKHVM